MTDKTSTLTVKVDGSGAKRGSDEAATGIRDVGKAADEATKKVDALNGQFQKFLRDTRSPLDGLKGLLAAAFSVDALVSFGRQLYDVNSRVQGFTATMLVVTQSQAAARKEFEYLTSIANKYGINIESLTGTYSKLAAAGKDSALTLKDLHKIFEAISMASNVLHLSTEETRLVFYALQQMVSKGNVSMEELRRQLAEKFPGAVNLMSEALEVTVKELEKMIKTGSVAADIALPKLADVILKSFGEASNYAVKSLNAEMARLHNSWFLFLKTVGESGVIDAAISLLQKMTGAVNDGQSGATQFGKALAEIINQVGEWVSKVTKGDVEEFFKTIVAVLHVILPIMQLIGQVIKGWALLLEPTVTEFVRIEEIFKRGTITEGLTRMALLIGSIAKPNSGIIDFLGKVADAYNKIEDKKANSANSKGLEPGFLARIRNVQDFGGDETKYGMSPENQLKAANALYAASLRSIEVKLKERDATSELAVMETKRFELLKKANDSATPELERVAAFKLLSSQEAELIALKKEANQELKEREKAYKAIYKPADDYINKLKEEADKLSLSSAQIDANNIKLLTANMSKREAIKYTDEMTKAQTYLNQSRQFELANKETDKFLETQNKDLEAVQKSIEKQLDYNETVGKTKSQIRDLDLVRIDSTITLKEMDLALAASEMHDLRYIETLKLEIQAWKDLRIARQQGASLDDTQEAQVAFDKGQKKMLDDWNKTTSHIADSLSDALLSGFDKGTSFADSFRKTLVKMFKDLVLKPIIQPVMNLAAGGIADFLGLSANPNGPGFLNLLSGGASLFGGSSSGPGGSTGGNGSSGIGGFSSSFGPGFSFFNNTWGGSGGGMGPPTRDGQTSMTYGNYASNAISGAIGGYAVGTALHSAFGNDRNSQGMSIGGTIGGAIGSIWGPIGAMVGSAIGSALGSLVKSGGGPKISGTGITDVDADGKVTNGAIFDVRRAYDAKDRSMDSLFQKSTDSIGKIYSDIAKALGIKNSVTFAQSGDSDPQGTAGNRVRTQVFLNGLTQSTLFDQRREGFGGKDPAALGPEMQLQATRAILAALKASELPTYLSKIIDGAMPDNMSQTELDAMIAKLIAQSEAFKALKLEISNITDLINNIKGDNLASFNDHMKTMNEEVDKAQIAFDKVVKTDDMVAIAAAEKELLNATMQRYTYEIQAVQTLVAKIKDIANAIKALASDSYTFNMQIGQKINSVGGTRDLAGLSLDRANVIRGSLGGMANPLERIGGIKEYVGAIDNWYSARSSAINANAQRQADAINAANQAIAEAQKAAIQTRITGLQKELELAQQMGAIADRAANMIKSITLSSANPLSNFAQLDASKEFTDASRQAFLSSTGENRSKAASTYLDDLQAQLAKLGETYQRPSQEYLDGYNAIMRQIREVQGLAETDAAKQARLTKEISDLQAASNSIQVVQVNAADLANVELQSLNSQALEYYTFAEKYYNEQNALQKVALEKEQAALNAQLNSITGGMDANLFIADRADKQVKLLQDIKEKISTATNITVNVTVGGGAGGGNSGGVGGGSGGSGNINVDANLANTIVDTVIANGPQIRRALAIS